MEISPISNENFHVSFNGINLTKGINSSIETVKKSYSVNKIFDRSMLPNQRVTKTLNGPFGHPYTGHTCGGGSGSYVEEDLEWPNPFKALKKLKDYIFSSNETNDTLTKTIENLDNTECVNDILPKIIISPDDITEQTGILSTVGKSVWNFTKSLCNID